MNKLMDDRTSKQTNKCKERTNQPINERANKRTKVVV